MTVRTTGIALALVLSGASLYAADARNFDKTLPLTASGAVELYAHNGAIQIRTWDRAEVEVHVKIEARNTSYEARRRLNAVAVDIEGSSDRISIKYDSSSLWAWSPWSMFWGEWDNSPDVHYTLTVPRTARLKIHTHNAKSDIRDVTAPLDVSTHNGSVWVANLDGPLKLSMHNGDAHVDFASFTHASRVSAHNGSTELMLPASSRFELHTVGHRSNVNSDFQANGGGPELRLTAHNGSFRVRSK